MIRTRGTMALVKRSLREDARLMRSYATRLVMVGLVFFFLFSIHEMSAWMGAPGLQLFQYVCIINTLFICLAGISFFSSVISEEKEDMTLGLLRMTDLNPISILLGKAGSRQIGGVLLILTQLPFTLLAITLGGVSLGQIVAAFTTLLAFMFALANLAMLISVISKRTRSASGVVAVLMLFYFIGPNIIKSVFGRWRTFGASYSKLSWWQTMAVQLSDWCIAASPFTRLTTINTTGFSGSPGCFQVYASLGAGAVLFGLSLLLFNRFNSQEHAPDPGPGRLGAGSRWWMAKQRKSGRRAWRHAVVWKDFYFVTGGRMGFIGRMVVYTVIIGSISVLIRVINPNGAGNSDMPALILNVGWLGMACELVVIASRVFHEEVRWRTLSTLVLLPVSIGQLARAKVAGCLISLLPAVLVFSCGVILLTGQYPGNTVAFLGEEWFWFSVLDFIMAIQLVALLSIHLKWGSIAAAAAMFFVGHMLAASLFSLMHLDSGSSSWIVCTTLVVSLTVIFYLGTIRGLARVAAQG